MLSVVVPAYNEEKHIDECLKSVLEQDRSELTDVIVVNDGSEDRTPEIVRELMDEYPKLELVDKEKNEGRALASLEGFKKSHGDFVLFIDADSVMEKGSINKIIEDHKNGADVVYGYVDVRNAEYFYPAVNKVGKKLSPAQRYGTPMMSVRRETFQEIGGFKNIRGFDVEVKLRLDELNVVWEDDAKVYTSFPTDFKYISKTKYLLGKTNVNFAYLHPEKYDIDKIINIAKVPGFYSVFFLFLILSLLNSIFFIFTSLLALFFVIVHSRRAIEINKETGKISYALFYFPYAFFTEILRTLGFYKNFDKFVKFLKGKIWD